MKPVGKCLALHSNEVRLGSGGIAGRMEQKKWSGKIEVEKAG
jgi:hypothetical protein